MGFIISTMLFLPGTDRKFHGHTSGALTNIWKYSHESVAPYLQLAVSEYEG